MDLRRTKGDEDAPHAGVVKSMVYGASSWERPIVFHQKAQNEIRRFSKEVRTRLGCGLFRLRMAESLSMPNARPCQRSLRAFQNCVSLVRRGRSGSTTASPKGVLVFHAFAKKTQRTPPFEMELARKRMKELLDA